MENALIAPASYWFLFIPTVVFSILIPVLGVIVFTYIMAIRTAPLVKSAPDNRFDRIPQRIYSVLKIWLAQYRQPRYMLAGVVHIVIFAGFLILSIRSCSLVIVGISESFVMPGFGGLLGIIYNLLKDYAATAVLVACAIAAYRRALQVDGDDARARFDHANPTPAPNDDHAAPHAGDFAGERAA